MKKRVRSESKIQNFIKAAENKISTSKRPDIILRSKEFIETIKCNEIDSTTLCRFGCPRFYLPKTAGLCDDPKKTATYSAKCADCWFLALTKEQDAVLKKKVRKPDEDGIKELLQILGYKDGTDFGEFLIKIKKQFS